ncbi:MAG TPA: PIN domain-containing protein [Bryobacteraceae bacterium]|nr:PIN domain-containing protein [Bryobacteraceae bacterium]
MNADNAAPCFVDTNVLVYALADDDSIRSPVAKQLLRELRRGGTLHTSVQVLQELYVSLTRKMQRPNRLKQALRFLDWLAASPVFETNYSVVREAAELSAAHRLSFWDALIVVAAARSGAKVLYSEDLQDGRTMLGVTIVNPFRRV